MTENNKNHKVDALLGNAKRWQKEMKKLREIAINNKSLTEEVKWRWPCYSINENNVVLIHGFKEYCALLFFKGSLLKDQKNILIQQTENVQARRQLRFSNLEQIVELESVIKDYINEAIAIEKAGLKVEFKKTWEFEVPEEFQIKLDEMPELEKAFKNLTPGRQRAYCFYFSNAKQSKTRTDRVEKYIVKILNGKGLDD